MHDTGPPSTVRPLPHRRGLAIALVILLVAACGTGTSDEAATTSAAAAAATSTTIEVATTAPSTTTTTAPTTTTSTTTLPPPSPGLGEAFLAEQVALLPIPEGEGAALAVVINELDDLVFAAIGTDPDAKAPTPDDAFRVGSITKLFTAAIVLQLVDAGQVDLDARVDQYVTRVVVPEAVLVRHLLHHSSGLHDYANAFYYGEHFVDSQQVWTPESSFALVGKRRLLFEPGSRYLYSNSNYLLLGILIEEVTGNSFETELRSRILEPLGLDSTYLAGFEEGPTPFVGYYWTELRGSVAPIDFDYTAVATMAWAAGAIVTTAADLHEFLSALFEARIVSPSSLEVMTGTDLEFSVFEPSAYEGLHFHGGHNPGYQSLVAHAPELGTTVFLVMTNDRLYGSFEAAAYRLLDRLQSELPS